MVTHMAYRAVTALVLLLYISCCLAYKALSDKSLQGLPRAGDDFDIRTGSLLAPILQPRVPDTPGSAAVRKHFLDFFKNQLPEWNIDLHNSSFTTPTSNGKKVSFVNIIATRDPPWATTGNVGRLALVAHYDSLSTLDGFIGAIDSAAPCAMLMHAARTLDEGLTKRWASMKDSDPTDMGDDAYRGVQILLLDGEEAFLHWTDTDSVYGARALAADWENTFHPAMATYHNALSSINLFVLLDLLGSPNPRIPSYFLTTHWAYKAMALLEQRLRKLGLFLSSSSRGSNTGSQDQAFLPDADKTEKEFRPTGIGDDHIPFLQRGVDILHLIPSPFPAGIWHEMADDGEHLDMDVVEDWTTLVTAFAAEWLNLEGFLATENTQFETREAEHMELAWKKLSMPAFAIST